MTDMDGLQKFQQLIAARLKPVTQTPSIPEPPSGLPDGPALSACFDFEGRTYSVTIHDLTEKKR
jgi:hypothetical protein